MPPATPAERRPRTLPRARRWAAVAVAALLAGACDGVSGATLRPAPARAGGRGPAPRLPLVAARDEPPAPALPPPPAAPPIGDWSEPVLGPDGAVDPAAYEAVAAAYDRPATVDARLGPSADDYGAAADAPTLPQRGAGGLEGDRDAYDDRTWTDWFAMSGPLAYSPDTDGDAGLARARNGSVYCSGAAPGWLLDHRVQTEPDQGNHYSRERDPALDSASWAAASGGAAPRLPVAMGQARAGGSIYSVVAFRDGMVGITGNGNDPNTKYGRYPASRVPEGDVPTAVAVTPGGEFALVTTWDTRRHVGEVAVFALEGAVHATGDADPEDGFRFGFPSSTTVRDLKLLGAVDLPFAAPTDIEATADTIFRSSRGETDNVGLDLGRQGERDVWYGHSGSIWKRTARAGYAVVSSRAEDAVAFVDLQPLLSYYRDMHFTTQDRHQQTQEVGPAPDQWPFTFAHAPEQAPLVAVTLHVEAPTAVAAGYARPPGSNDWRSPEVWDDGVFAGSAYVATLAGQFLRFDVGGLATEEEAGVPAQVDAVDVGRNPTSIEYTTDFAVGNDLVVTSRGDRAVVQLEDDLTRVGTLRDSRLVDPVGVALSRNRRFCGGATYLSALDHRGAQVVNYTVRDRGDYGFGHALAIPGRPFLALMAEVI